MHVIHMRYVRIHILPAKTAIGLPILPYSPGESQVRHTYYLVYAYAIYVCYIYVSG